MTIKDSGGIGNEGMGGFLNPPTHPEHSKSVQGKDFSISLSSAVEADWLTDYLRERASHILSQWEPLPINSLDVQDWIRQVMGYFKGCYQSHSQSLTDNWNADKLMIEPLYNPIDYQDRHAGVHLIRKYYPDFRLTDEIINQAYWGIKPS